MAGGRWRQSARDGRGDPGQPPRSPQFPAVTSCPGLGTALIPGCDSPPGQRQLPGHRVGFLRRVCHGWEGKRRPLRLLSLLLSAGFVCWASPLSAFIQLSLRSRVSPPAPVRLHLSGGFNPVGNVVDSQSPRLLANQLRWDLTAEQIENMAAELTERTKLVYDRVGSQEQGEVSYENTLKALADVEVEYTGVYASRESRLSENQCAVIKILLVAFLLCAVISFLLPSAPSAAWWFFFFSS